MPAQVPPPTPPAQTRLSEVVSWIASIGAAASFGVGIEAVKLDEYAVAILCWCVCALVILVKINHWCGLATSGGKKSVRLATVVAVVLLLALMISWVNIKRDGRAWSSILPEDVAVFVSCQPDEIPAVVPKEGRIHFLMARDTPGESNDIEDYIGQPNSVFSWPLGAKGVGGGYRCEITNDSDRAIFNLALLVHLTFETPVVSALAPGNMSMMRGKVTAERDRTVSVPRLDSGPQYPYVFWIWNCCLNEFVDVSLPPIAALHGPLKSQTVKVSQPPRNFPMPLFPNSAQLPGHCNLSTHLCDSGTAALLNTACVKDADCVHR